MKDEILAFFGGLIGLVGVASIAWAILVAPALESLIEVKGKHREKN
jgi:hypothetical protein